MASGPALVFGQLVFPLNKVTNSVGRKDRITNMVPDVDLGTLDQERSVSRRHAEITYDHGTVTLRDLGSTNGTTVSGGRLALQVDRTLEDGDEVGFGGVNLTYHSDQEWPEGVEAEWPPEPEPQLEETMVVPPAMAEETMVAPPPPVADFASSETAIFAPGEVPAGDGAGVSDAPPPLPEAEPIAPAPEPEPEPVAAVDEGAAPEPEAAAEPAPSAAAQPVEAPVYVACSNHPHLPAIGVCPGCLEAFCVDCLPEREDGLMVCNRCAGISYRLAAIAGAGAPATAAAVGSPAPAPPGFPEAPQAGGPAPAEDQKKRWPF